ncbi:FAD-dependent monooxygenase [uncultured Tenacibaculum sp.]|uniref:NAD(P)/FAD-dependent oxidoreductase n=1 Tax=uncultured Tenacibaculum sp. TaxID=174713 RepID=UPI00262C393C|nr:FAD-dependent monooxygenase [uncultured Tenacibaculum sp.]
MNPETHLKTKILIVGKGVSGLLLSYLLEKKGIECILLNKEVTASATILAETIPPSTLSLLKDIDMLTLFEKCATKTYGYQSIWNGIFKNEDFFSHNPFKYGLKLNKRKVIFELEKKVASRIINYNQLKNITSKTSEVTTIIKSNNTKYVIESSLIIDATGRNRAVLNSLNTPIISHDNNIAFIGYLPKTKTSLKYGFFTETFENGWGTISDLNETTRIMTLYSSKNDAFHKKLKVFSNWDEILINTQVLKKHLPPGDFKVIGRLANSSIPQKIVGKNWLSVGDAAMAFDPISSHGISNAIYCAIKASNSINDFITKNNLTSFNKYQETIIKIFNQYYQIKERLYS